ncbi:DNA alkylation repair protein [Bacillus horti]|uniref:3-methyladenine DNA glycosylase AlkC n=1 Tax=Caldalkalibacillus horti TaxID=77523 RepID=A0ABT9VYL3_9BACI|nr:DNA alkylation repair protein [Bacillus horti]MDQ0165979.1 3-methyladenine DNA glycosylase AlkC [Bacillus horti]
MDQLKNIYSQQFIQDLSTSLQNEYPAFQANKFKELVFQEDWEELALKQRMRRITNSMYQTLPQQYEDALDILYTVAPQFTGLAGIIFPDYVEQYGLEHWNTSMHALATFTPYSTSEYAVRPFFLLDQDKMIAQMLKWSTNSNEHVRRLASEGSRPRLPWGLSVPALKADPTPLIPTLEQLKQDNSLYVRKSVANHLNDISKTHPEIVLSLANEWYGVHEYTNWIVKHACRSLLKQGDTQALSLFGYENGSATIENFHCDQDRVEIGESLHFTFDLHSKDQMKARIEYAIDFVKARGQRHRKVFKISEVDLQKREIKSYTKKHSFKDLTTRKHYIGGHTLSIIVNGEVKETFDFELI